MPIEADAPAAGREGAAKRKRALVIVNARSRRGAELLDSSIAQLKDAGLDVRLEAAESAGGIAPLIRRLADRVDLVVVGGGDGTMNAAAPGLIETGLPLGILPLGTANDLARTLGIPPDLASATAIIAEGRTRRIDIGEVNGHPFFNVASIGLSVELAQELTRDIKRRYGRLGYAIAAVRALSRAKPFRAEIIGEEGRTRVVTLQIAVGNGRYYGGGNAVEKDAAIDDQSLDLYSLEMTRAWKLALMARSFRTGEHGAWEEVRAIRAKEFDIRTRRPRSVNADGEIVTKTPAHFSLKENAVTVFTPKATAGA